MIMYAWTALSQVCGLRCIDAPHLGGWTIEGRDKKRKSTTE
jgi:hypothetical protein